MTMWARIENGAVAEITDIDPDGRFPSFMVWVEFDGRTNIGIGWRYIDGEFLPPPGPTDEEVEMFIRQRRNSAWSRSTVESSSGVKSSTDDRARDRVNSKIAYFGNIGDSETSVSWKGPDGWYDATAADFQEIQIAQERIQQRAFDAERLIYGQSFDSLDEAGAAYDAAFNSLEG